MRALPVDVAVRMCMWLGGMGTCCKPAAWLAPLPRHPLLAAVSSHACVCLFVFPQCVDKSPAEAQRSSAASVVEVLKAMH